MKRISPVNESVRSQIYQAWWQMEQMKEAHRNAFELFIPPVRDPKEFAPRTAEEEAIDRQIVDEILGRREQLPVCLLFVRECK